MEYELLEKRVRRLVCKLKTHNVDLEVFNEDEIDYGAIIGKGGEGIVQHCSVKYHGLPIEAAMKTLQDVTDDGIAITLEEIELLCLAHDPIVDTTLKVYGVAIIRVQNDPEMANLAIITEAGLMNALQLYQSQDIPLLVTLDLWAKTAAAIHMMHTKKILHHDIKPENILITRIVRDSNGDIEQFKCKIIDLGMGKRLYSERIITDDILGTNGYHPPEVLSEEGYDFRADLFSLGVTFCVMLHAPTFLKRQLPKLLERLHTAKADGTLGDDLFETILEPTIEKHFHIPSRIKDMLCTLLACQDDRTVTLLEVVDICHEESKCLKDQINQMPPIISPFTACQDSGFSSNSVENNREKMTSIDLSRRSHLSNSSSTSSTQVMATRNNRPRRVTRSSSMSCTSRPMRTRSCSSKDDGSPTVYIRPNTRSLTRKSSMRSNSVPCDTSPPRLRSHPEASRKRKAEDHSASNCLEKARSDRSCSPDCTFCIPDMSLNRPPLRKTRRTIASIAE